MSAAQLDSRAAADPTRSAWVSANAGAGKTYTLANRVTRLLLAGARPEHILCLTYTKAAAAEMAGRLFDQLGQWAMADDAALAKRIAEIGAPPRDAEGLKEARRLFALALETPGGLKIQTIHSFCQYLLARFPLEARVPPAFRVLDDQTARELRDDARTRVLERAGSGDDTLAKAAAHLVTHASEARLQQILDGALGGDRRKFERFLSSLSEAEDAMAEAVRRAHGAGAGDTCENIASSFIAAIKAEDARLREVVGWLSSGGKTDVKNADALLRAIESGSFENFREAFLTGKGARYASLATKKLSDARPDLLQYLESIADRFLVAEGRYRATHAASLAEAALTLAAAARHEYAAAKRARGVLDYDDLIIETLRLLERDEASGWVLYKLDGGLDHILIDEAQDTSPEQWNIVRKLTEDFFAGKGARDDDSRGPRTIFAVGDEKQSIFSFQGADPAQFDINRTLFEARAAENSFVDVQLPVSRRSAPQILQFVDEVFADPAAREGVTSAGVNVAHQAHRAEAKGRVEFWPALSPSKTPEPDYWLPVDVESEASPVVRLADRVAEQIKSWTNGRMHLPGHKKPISPGDIMVLMPRREPFASELIRQLKRRGVPVAGADRIKLQKQIAVMDLVALGRFALLPEDDLNLAALLRSPLIGIDEEQLFALSTSRKGMLWRELVDGRGELASFAFAHEFLSESLARADFAPPYEFYAHVLAARGMRKRLLARLGAEANDAIDEFLSLALAYEGLNTPSLEGFLHWIERGDAEIKRDMERGRDEVRVMTVHGAKGLEADIVILPDTTSLPDPPGKRGDLLYTDKGVIYPVTDSEAPAAVKAAKAEAEAEALMEHRRLLYVALTRAKDFLYVCGFENKKGVKPGSWYELAQRAAQSLGKAMVRGDDTLRVIGDAELESAPLSPNVDVPSITLPGWVLAEPAPEHTTPRLIRPSDAAGLEEPGVFSPAGPKAAARFRRGQLVHTLLARLPDIAPELRRDIALRFLAARDVASEEAAALTDETLAVISDPRFAAAFAPTARAEVAIVADLPELGLGARASGRIDRLAVSPDEVLAIDFKTNRPPPERAEDVPALYRTQMALYRAALAKVFPGRRIACALIWTEGPRLMALPDALLDAEKAHIRVRLDPGRHGS
jgi:ATP-dependent helicase/nuclease subunit A